MCQRGASTFSLVTDDRVMTVSPLSPSAWPTSPSVRRQPRTRRDESAARLLTATNAGACRASTQASSPWKHSYPTQTERNSARCRNDAFDYDTLWSWFDFPSLTVLYIISSYSLFFLVHHQQAAILQQTADYIFALEQEKTQLLAQNNQLKRFIQVAAFLIVSHRYCVQPILNSSCWTSHITTKTVWFHIVHWMVSHLSGWFFYLVP